MALTKKVTLNALVPIGRSYLQVSLRAGSSEPE